MQSAIAEIDKGEIVFWAVAAVPTNIRAWAAEDAPWSTWRKE